MGVELPEISGVEFSQRLFRVCRTGLSEEAVKLLYLHYVEMRRWNPRISLVGPVAREEIVERHYGESLLGLAFLQTPGGVLVDIGSGAGFPGFVLAAARPDLEVTLVEARERKSMFLQTVCRKAGLSCRCLNARVATAPVEDLPDEIDWITSRAVRFEDLGLPVLLPRLGSTGSLLVWVGARDPELPPDLFLRRQKALPGSLSRRILELARRSPRQEGA